MMANADQYDFFVSYARRDNTGGWITCFLDELQAEHRKYSGGRDFRIFFDKSEIRSLDDWRHRIYESVAASRLLVAFISPAYLASEWCRREWSTWIDVEIAKHVLSDGAAPIYIVEVPWLHGAVTEQQVAEQLSAFSRGVTDLTLARAAVAVGKEVSRRQLTVVRPFFDAGLEALRHEDLRRVLGNLAKNLAERAEHVEAARNSLSTIPPYNRRFVGRLEELTLLRQLLHQGRTGIIAGHRGDLAPEKSVVASVHGLGGIGKTELAFTYAHAFAGLYPGGRFLVPCEGATDLRLALLKLDEVFRDQIDDEQRKSLDLHFGAIRDCLRRRVHESGRILLVLDNVSEPELLAPEQTDQVRGLGADLHLLVTTRLGAPESVTFDDLHWLTLGELTQENSLRLLEKYRLFVTPAEQTAAERIARRLGGYALCVEVVGAYLSQHPEESYEGFLETMGLSDLEQIDEAAERRDVVTRRHNNEKRLGAILAPTLAGLTPVMREMLDFAALLPPDEVALPWLKALVGLRFGEQVKDAADWELIVSRLLALALFSRAQDSLDDSHRPRLLRCHRLLQDFIRTRLASQERAARQQAVDNLVEARLRDMVGTQSWHASRWEIEPLAALAPIWAETGHPEAARLMFNVGGACYQMAEWSLAESLLRRSVGMLEQQPAAGAKDLIVARHNLADVLLRTGRGREAESLFRQNMALAREKLGARHLLFAREVSGLAVVLKENGQGREAEELLRLAQVINEQSAGAEETDRARDLITQGLVLSDQHRYDEAEAMIRRALAMDEEQVGPDHVWVARDLGNLGALLGDTDRAAEALPLLQRALAITEGSLGPDHPDVAICLNNLSSVLGKLGRRVEAEEAIRRALAITESKFDPDHPDVAIRLSNLALLLQERDPAEAERLMRRAVAIDEKNFHPMHPILSTHLGNLAELVEVSGRLEEAEPLMRRALAIEEANTANGSPKLAMRLHALAILCQKMGRLEEAEPLMRRALELNEVRRGPDHPEIARQLTALTELLRQMQRLDETVDLQRRALVIEERRLGREDPEIAIRLNELALLLSVAFERHGEAEPLLRRALEIFLRRKQRNGSADPELPEVVGNYTRLLQDAGYSVPEVSARLNDVGRPYGVQWKKRN